MSSRKDAFRIFHATPRNVVQSWSALSDDGKTVVLAMWKNRHWTSPTTYEDPGNSTNGILDLDWINAYGNRERRNLLDLAQNQHGGFFRYVEVTAVDPAAVPRAERSSVDLNTLK